MGFIATNGRVAFISQALTSVLEKISKSYQVVLWAVSDTIHQLVMMDKPLLPNSDTIEYNMVK